MRRLTLFLMMACFELTIAATTSPAADTCRTFLVGASNYNCRAVTESGEQFTMGFHFTPVVFSTTKFLLSIDNSAPARCSCKATKLNLKKPQKIKFNTSKDFHCVVMSGPEFSGPEFTGPESFSIAGSSFEGQAKKKGIKKGQAVDFVGRAIAYDCEID